MRKLFLATLLTFFLTSCTLHKANNNATPAKRTTPITMSKLAYGKSMFEKGYYKKAMKELLPLAANGNAEAQYAVGYMYYYGYGVTKDIESGTFWIKRSAKQQFKPAQKALSIISKKH